MTFRLVIAFCLHSIFLLGQNPSEYESKFEYFEDGSVKVQYKVFDGQKVDTLKVFDKKGRLESIHYFGAYGSNEPIYREDYFYSGASRKMTCYYVLLPPNEPMNVGVQKAYWKGGSLMDSVIYDEHGRQIYRARFDKNGELQFEEQESFD